jgi:hypothetical protein
MNETAKQLVERLKEQPIVSLDAREWMDIAEQFDEVERHSTLSGGDLVVVRLGTGYAVVEQPTGDKRVIRRLANIEEVRRFVTNRLEDYERMWDGCGCKIDYYS